MRSASSKSGTDRKYYSSLMLNETFVMRIAGLPVQSLICLRFTQTLQLVDTLYQLEQHVVMQEKALAEKLYGLVATLVGVEHKQVRNRVIELRRALFQGRLPRVQCMHSDVFEVLPTEIAAEIRLCHRLRGELVEFLAATRICFEQELQAKRQELFTVAQQEPLLRGLILASRSMYQEISQHAEAQAHDAEQKLERGLISYIMRATAKTSPYSTFTSIAPGRRLSDETLTDNTIQARIQTDTVHRRSRQSCVEVNLLIIQQIARAVEGWPEVRATLPLSINSTLVETERTLYFLARLPQGTETIIHLGNNATVRHILTLIRRIQPMTYNALLQQLVGVNGPERVPAVESFLEQLVAKGLLHLSFAIPEQSPDYLGQLIERLTPLRQSRVRNLVQQLTLLRSALRDYAQLCSLTACSEQAQRIHNLLQAVYVTVDLAPSQLPAKNLFYENSFLPEMYLTCGSAAWQETEKNLGYLQQLVGLYDPFLPGRLELAAFFVEQYGEQAEVSVLSFYEAFYKATLVTGGGVQEMRAALIMQLFTMPFFIPDTRNPALQQVVYWRNQIVQWLEHQPVDAWGTRRLPVDELALLLDECTSVLQIPQSLAYYCQVYPDDQQFQLIINALQSGFGRTLGRLYSVQGTTTAHRDAPIDNTDPLVVSIQGVFGSNINVRSEQTPYEIVYPGQVSMRPAEEQLPFNDLLVSYNAQSHRLSLHSRRLQRTLLPVHLGMMSDYWLPPMYRFLLWAFADAPTDPLWGLRLIDTPAANVGSNEGIRAAPRVFLGNICLYRAHWLVSGSAVPRREKGENDFTYFLRLQRWRRDNALPPQGFVRVNAFDFTQRTHFQVSATEVSTSRVRRKPLYIDFENYFSVLMFERLVEKSEFGFLLEEVFPALETQVVHAEQDAYVSEYVFEVEQKR